MCKELTSRAPFVSLVVLVGLVSLAVSGCDDDDNGVFDDNEAGVRFVHAVPGAGPVDIFVAGEQDALEEGLAYGDSSEFQRLDPGLVEFEIREAGAGPDADPLATTSPLDLFEDEEWSAVITGSAEDGLQSVIVQHDFERDSGPFVNFVHAVPDAPAVGLDVGDDETLEIESVEPFSAAPGGAFVVPEDDFQLAVVADDERLTAFTLPELDTSDEFLAVALGRVADAPQSETGFNILIVGEGSEANFIAQNPVVYVTHAVSDGPPVNAIFRHQDEEFDDRVFEATDLSFGTLSERIQVPPGTLEADVIVAENQQALFDQETRNLDPGLSYLVVLAGSAGEDDLELMTLGTTFEMATEEPVIRLAHASPDADTVDVALVEDGSLSTPPLAEDLDFAVDDEDQEGAPIPSGAQTIGLAEAGELEALASFNIEVPDGARLFGVVAGAVAPLENEQPLQLLLINTSVSPWELTSFLDP